MSVSVTVQVPSSVYRLAQKTSQAVSRPVEQILADVISAASPVTEDLSSELQAELDALAQLSDEDLWKAARQTFPAAQRRQYDQLLEKNNAGKLTAGERTRLQDLRLESESLMLRKAHAYALLKWRGHILPALDKIPRPR